MGTYESVCTSAAQRGDDRDRGAGEQQPDDDSLVVVLMKLFEDAMAERRRHDQDRQRCPDRGHHSGVDASASQQRGKDDHVGNREAGRERGSLLRGREPPAGETEDERRTVRAGAGREHAREEAAHIVDHPARRS